MNGFYIEVQPAVRKETVRVAFGTAACVILMWIVFAVLHMMMPERIPMGYSVIFGGLGGGLVAVLNFFLMGLTVQKVVESEDEESARMQMRAGYSRRMLLQMLWVVIVIVASCFHLVAGIVPLLFPSLGIKILGILNK